MGAFTSVDGVSAAYIASYNGASFSALGSGLNNLGFPNALVLGPDGQLWVFGVFTQAGDIPADRIAIWRNNAWHAADVDIGDVVREGIVTDYGVVDSTKYSIYVGTDREGAASWGGKVTVTNPGSREAFPLIVINRSGGTSATLRHITNETANQKMQFNYLIADGETLTLDLTPGAKSITSSVFGNVVDELLPRSDFADFRLLPGANEITVWVEEVGGPTVTSYVLWRAPYWSVDGVL
jgi:hypothetical protein